MLDETEDPVEYEVDVFLSQALSEKLYLFQYPMRPSHVTHDYSSFKDVKLKQNQQKIHIDVPIEPSGENYSDSRGENYANMMELGKPPGSSEQYYKSGFLDKQTLVSSQCIPQDQMKRYALGVLKEKELHLTSLKGIYQLRPSFDYLDCVGAGEKRLTLAVQEESESSEEEEPKHITVKFSRHNQTPHPPQDNEPWVRLHTKSFQDPLSDEMRGLLFSDSEAELAAVGLHSKSYFNALLPPEDREALTTVHAPLDSLKDCTLQEAIRMVMMRVGVLKFKTLCSLIQDKADQLQDDILTHLMKFAVLVQGCWVVRSNLLYPEGFYSAYNSVPHSVMCRARDLILLKFALTYPSTVSRKEITQQVKIPHEELLDILKGLGRQRVSIGWEFVFDIDKDFLSHHPEVVAKQLEWWRSQQEKLRCGMDFNKEDPSDVARQRGLGKKRRSSQHAKPSVREDNIPSTHNSVDSAGSEQIDSPMDTKDVMSPLTSWLSKAINLGVVPLHQIRHQLDQHRSSLSSKLMRECTDSDEVLVRGLLAAGMTEVTMKDTSVGADGKPVRLFTRTKVGNDTDKYRHYVLQLFKETSSVKKKQVCEEIRMKTGEDPNIKLVTALLKELCYSKGSVWHLKGT